MKDGLGGGRGDVAVRTVKAKREADEAGLCQDRFYWRTVISRIIQTRSTGKVFTGLRH